MNRKISKIVWAVLFVMVAVIGIYFIVVPQLQKQSPESEIKSTPSVFCGGIAGIRCPEGYRCVLDGSYPDAGGKCQR